MSELIPFDFDEVRQAPVTTNDGWPVMKNPIEPSADVRQAARQVRELYIALLAEGFTPTEALVIIGQVFAAGRQQ